MKSGNLVVLKMFSSVEAAEAAAASLEANGIESVVQADDAGGMLPTLQNAEGVKVLVAVEDAPEAVQILAAKTDISPKALEALASGSGDEEARPAAIQRPRLLSLVVAFFLGAMSLYLWQMWNRQGTKTYDWDRNHDGRPDAREVFQAGKIIEYASDRNFDGRLDEWYYYERRELARFEADENYDGKVDLWWIYTNGLPANGRQDTDFNGMPDAFSHQETPAVLITDWRPNGALVIILRQVFHHGVLTQESRDVDRDGLFDLDIRYDAFLNAVQTNQLKLLSPR